MLIKGELVNIINFSNGDKVEHTILGQGIFIMYNLHNRNIASVLFSDENGDPREFRVLVRRLKKK